jgi:hypothetical protein
MPARYLRHLAVERQPQTYLLTLQAATVDAAAVLKQAQKPLAASTVTVAALTAFKARLLTLQAATAVVAAVVKQVGVTRSAATVVQGLVSKLVETVKSAVSAVLGVFVQGPTPVITHVVVCPATYVNVTVGPL